MLNEFRQKRKMINKKMKQFFLMWLFSFLWFFNMNYGGIDKLLLLLEVMRIVLQLDNISLEFLRMSGDLVLPLLPLSASVFFRIKMLETIKEREKIQIEETNYLNKMVFDEGKADIDDLLEQIKRLPRREQMKFLNTAKRELTNIEKNKKIKGQTSSELALNYLQDGLEDILFPPFTDDKRDYVKTKKK